MFSIFDQCVKYLSREDIHNAEERGIRNGIREKSSDDSTIKANGSSEQCSMYYGEWVKHLSREDRNCWKKREQKGEREKGEIDWALMTRLSKLMARATANGPNGSACSVIGTRFNLISKINLKELHYPSIFSKKCIIYFFCCVFFNKHHTCVWWAGRTMGQERLRNVTRRSWNKMPATIPRRPTGCLLIGVVSNCWLFLPKIFLGRM